MEQRRELTARTSAPARSVCCVQAVYTMAQPVVVRDQPILARQAHQEFLRITRTARETRHLAGMVAAYLRGGDVICLYGELGSGKTTFIQGLAEGLNVRGNVVSPSFTLVHQHQGRLPLYHLDLYRLSAGDLADIGIDEILASDAVVAVEWAERLPPRLCEDGLRVQILFADDGEDTRRVRITGLGPRGIRIAAQLHREIDADPGS